MTLALEFPPISHLLVWRDLLLRGTVLGVNKPVLLMLVAAALTVWIFLAGGRRRALVPTGMQNVAEMGVEFIEREIVLSTMGPEGRPWIPFLTSMFFFIFFLNIFEIIPFIQFPVTSRMAIPLYMAVQTWLLMIIVGFKSQGFAYLKHTLFPPGLPGGIGGIFLKGLLALIELVSVFILRPFTLAIRLFANLLAGHMLLTTFYLLASSLWVKSVLAVALPLPVFMAIFITAFEVLVSVLQAYIFTILTAVYVGESMHGH